MTPTKHKVIVLNPISLFSYCFDATSSSKLLLHLFLYDIWSFSKSLHFQTLCFLQCSFYICHTLNQGFRSRRDVLRRGTISCVKIGCPTSILTSRSGYLGMFHVLSVRIGRDSGTSHSIEKLGQPCPTGFKTLH